MRADEFVLVLVTVPDAEAGARIGRALVEARLAACVNIVPAVRSIYEWAGNVNDEGEALCLIKSRRELYPALRDRVSAMHPYEVPEIVALSLAEGNAPYLAWLAAGTSAR
jgi:periplasmic divalent cation tolerance protein